MIASYGDSLCQTACRVKFDTQETEHGKDITLVQAAKAFFANSRLSFWNLTAFLLPKVCMPLLKILSHAFPTKTDLAMEEALATVYEASDALIKVHAYCSSISLCNHLCAIAISSRELVNHKLYNSGNMSLHKHFRGSRSDFDLAAVLVRWLMILYLAPLQCTSLA